MVPYPRAMKRVAWTLFASLAVAACSPDAPRTAADLTTTFSASKYAGAVRVFEQYGKNLDSTGTLRLAAPKDLMEIRMDCVSADEDSKLTVRVADSETWLNCSEDKPGVARLGAQDVKTGSPVLVKTKGANVTWSVAVDVLDTPKG
jgi:hypothetical protein